MSRYESSVRDDSPEKVRPVVDKSFLWFLLPTLLQTLVGIGVMVPITTYYLDPADLGTVAILTALAMLVTPLASTGDNWVLSTHWHATSASGRKELLFNLLLANFGMKSLWVVFFGCCHRLCLPHLIRDYQPRVSAILWIGAAGTVGRQVLGDAEFIDGD